MIVVVIIDHVMLVWILHFHLLLNFMSVIVFKVYFVVFVIDSVFSLLAEMCGARTCACAPSGLRDGLGIWDAGILDSGLKFRFLCGFVRPTFCYRSVQGLRISLSF